MSKKKKNSFIEKIKNFFYNQFKTNKIRTILFIIIFLVLLGATIFSIVSPSDIEKYNIKEISYVQYLDKVKNKEIKEIQLDGYSDQFIAIDKKGKQYSCDNPEYDNFKLDTLKNDIKVTIKDNSTKRFFYSLLSSLSYFIPFIIIFYVFFNLSNSMGNKEVGVLSTSSKITFKDVAGLKEVKEDMQMLLKFLKEPKIFRNRGLKLPKGVIFYGDPGTGKTLLAKALAGEANVPFYSISGSDFVEMYVGVGAKRVRSLFKKARENSPCIIFIDEIDAIGSRRGGNPNSESRQTINALLAEMDGFIASDNVLVIGATNRIEDLDKALIRPGRFDKHIKVPLPESAEDRKEILNLYLKNKKVSEEIDLDQLAKDTIGYSPAEIETLINEAGIISVKENKECIDKECIDSAVYQLILKGHMQKDAKRNEKEIELVAWHEAGHAVLNTIYNKEISKVTIIPSTSGVGGFNLTIPAKLSLYSKKELEEQIRILYGGRVGELLLLGDENLVTTGASNDIQQATSLINEMIRLYGMDEEFSMLNLDVLNIKNEDILSNCKKISKKIYAETLTLLKENKELLKEIALKLIEKETITGKEIEEIYKKYKNNI